MGYHADSIINYVGGEYKGVPVRYVYQNERKGIAHAVLMAKDALADDFIMCLADEILFEPSLLEMTEKFKSSSLDCLCGVVIDGDDLSMKPLAYDVDEKGRVTAVTEKPTQYNNDIRGVGECIFSKDSLKYLEKLEPNPIRGEYEMGDWIRLLVEDKKGVEVFEISKGYRNINYAKDIEEAEETIRQSNKNI